MWDIITFLIITVCVHNSSSSWRPSNKAAHQAAATKGSGWKGSTRPEDTIFKGFALARCLWECFDVIQELQIPLAWP